MGHGRRGRVPRPDACDRDACDRDACDRDACDRLAAGDRRKMDTVSVARPGRMPRRQGGFPLCHQRFMGISTAAFPAVPWPRRP
jgi:hypothetical protein